MLSSLLATKLFFPLVRSAIVARPRLVERLEAGLRGHLTLVSAPTGFGKTMLLSEWRAGPGREIPVAWYSLDPADNDLIRFFQYLCTALDLIHPGLNSQIFPFLQSPEPPSPEAILTQLVNLLNEAEQDYVLVLDDFHVIETASIQEALAFLLNHMPPRLHLVVLTRADPALPLARLRARSQLVEIRSEHLRFTIPEADEFLNQVMGLSLSPEEVAALEARTEGWVAGLQLAGLSMQGRDDVEGFVTAFTGSHHYIVDYLAEEVLNRQPENVRDFLLKTSFLARLNGPLCDAVTGQTGGQAMLARLAHANLFLVPLDDELRWFRYHHLFGELLQNRLRHLQPGMLPGLHRLAANWFEKNKLVDEAISHALAGQDYEHARQLFRKDNLKVMYDRSLGSLSQWLKAFPEEIIKNDPWMCIAQAHILWATGQRKDIEQYAACAQASLTRMFEAGELSPEDPEYIAVFGEILAFQALAAVLNRDADNAIRYAEQAVNLLPRFTLSRVFALGALYISHAMQGDLDQSIQVCMEAGEVAQVVNYPSMLTTSVYTLGSHLSDKGKLRQAYQVYRDCLEFGKRQGQAEIFYYGAVHIGLAQVLSEWNELDQADQLMETGLALLRKGGTNILLPLAYPLASYLRWARGDIPGALAVLDIYLNACAGMDPSLYQDEYEMLRARYLVDLGQTTEAHAWLAKSGGLTSAPLKPDNSQLLFFNANLKLLLGLTKEAIADLSSLEEICRVRGYTGRLILALALQASAWKLLGEDKCALDSLEQAFSLAEPENYIRVFVDRGKPMKTLLAKAAAQGISPVYAHRLLAAFPSEEPSDEPPGKPHTLLSKRELELLNIIAAGRSNKEIAALLYISLGTVKRHTVNIFNKLDVQNRTEAVSRARQLGLL